MTSSPGPTPNQRSMSIAPEVHEFTQRTGVPVSLPISASRARVFGPVVTPTRVGECIVDLVDHVLVDERQREGDRHDRPNLPEASPEDRGQPSVTMRAPCTGPVTPHDVGAGQR